MIVYYKKDDPSIVVKMVHEYDKELYQIVNRMMLIILAIFIVLCVVSYIIVKALYAFI